MNYPLISIVIATKNSEKTLALTLQSIKNQSYPQDKVEVLVIDGISQDTTRMIAKKFEVKVIDNPKVGFIPGKHLGYLKAKGDYLMYLDSDEELYNPDSLKVKILAFLSDQQIKGVVSTGYKSPKNFPFINRYINEFGDPFSFFIYRSTINYEFFLKKLLERYKRVIDNDNFAVFDFSSAKPLPLIELVAMGCMVDLNYLRKEFPEIRTTPNLIPHLFYLINKRGSLIALTKNDPIIHYSSDTLSRYLKKIAWRVRNNIFSKYTVGTAGFAGRDLFQPLLYRWKRYLYIFYSLSMLFPIIDSFKLVLTRKDVVFLIHPFLCIYTIIIIMYYYLLKLMKINPLLKTYGT